MTAFYIASLLLCFPAEVKRKPSPYGLRDSDDPSIWLVVPDRQLVARNLLGDAITEAVKSGLAANLRMDATDAQAGIKT